VISRARFTWQNYEESYENDGAVESQYQAFHGSLEISKNRRFPHFHSCGGGPFYRATGLNTTKTKIVYTEILTPPRPNVFSGIVEAYVGAIEADFVLVRFQ
jgi:hypothetical protein